MAETDSSPPAKIAKKERFAELDEKSLENILKEKDAKNTQQATERCKRILDAYLQQKNLKRLEEMTASELNTALYQFYAEVRTPSGEKYKTNSFQTIRHGLNRYTSSKLNIDIVKGEEFKEANTMFSAVMKDLKKTGFGAVNHYPPVTDNDLNLMANYFKTWRSEPVVLLHKVFVDIMLHFGRRGRENLRQLKRGIKFTSDLLAIVSQSLAKRKNIPWFS